MSLQSPRAACAGSFIFSQCLLALNGGTTSRAGGLTLSLLQFVTFLLPISLVHLLPNFYYGGLLVLLGTEIIRSWLFLTYWRITKAEFALSWLTFLSVIGLCAILPVQVHPQPVKKSKSWPCCHCLIQSQKFLPCCVRNLCSSERVQELLSPVQTRSSVARSEFAALCPCSVSLSIRSIVYLEGKCRKSDRVYLYQCISCFPMRCYAVRIV
jgi:hypothetical protein